jgi:methylphosphotriester-DNA--protein-cysteine methyltransferase
MQYQKFEPSPPLKDFVECYFVWQSVSGPVDDLIVESPPNGFCSIVFNFGDVYFLQNKKYERLQVPMEFVSGQNIYTYKLHLHGNIGIAGIVLKPTALATIFQLPVYDFTEERIDLYQVFKKSIVDQYAHQIRSAEDVHTRVKHLEAFVMQEFRLRRPETDYIDKAANFIVENHGMLQVAELLKDSCMSRRTFERKFFNKVGLSPKYYARIRRIAHLCNLMAGKKKVDWAKLFYECEYYDHAHFIKDFEEFTGRTPQQYLKENSELANYVEKPTTQSLPED